MDCFSQLSSFHLSQVKLHSPLTNIQIQSILYQKLSFLLHQRLLVLTFFHRNQYSCKITIKKAPNSFFNQISISIEQSQQISADGLVAAPPLSLFYKCTRQGAACGVLSRNFYDNLSMRREVNTLVYRNGSHFNKYKKKETKAKNTDDKTILNTPRLKKPSPAFATWRTLKRIRIAGRRNDAPCSHGVVMYFDYYWSWWETTLRTEWKNIVLHL